MSTLDLLRRREMARSSHPIRKGIIHLERIVGMPTINVALFLDLCTPREAVLVLIEFLCRVPSQSSKLRINCTIRHLCLVTRDRRVRPEEKRRSGNGSIWSLTVGG